ncbi:MAG TPA: thiamine pyrophosphate-dependent enzyme [Stellaceae bacterium]|jgi:acetolactate synthase-1/2/3 large subunit|nr:thiamine pyrophosphate-dependent enzyme [Stellaceae bacterium]
MTQTVARLLAESLEAHDVDQVYCVPGESYVGLTSALIEKNSIRVVVCRHEGGAGYMAVADGRLRDRAGVAIVSRGPGLSNAMVALHSAYHDATPVVMLVGQVERRDFGRLALQEQNYSRLLSDVTKEVIEVGEPEQVSEAIARAFHLAESGTPGPVAVIVPEDLFDVETDAAADPARPRVVAAPRPNDLDRLAVMLEAAERPLILVGGAMLADAVHDNAVFGELNRLAEQWVLPICPTHRRPQLFDATHPNFGGYMGIRVPPDLLGEMKRADLMVALGERMTDSVSQSYSFPNAPKPQLPFVHVWPDPDEVGRVWRPDLGLPCSPYEVIRGLLRRGAPADSAKRRGWVAGLNAIHRRLLAKEWEPTSDGVNFAAVVCEVDKHLAPDATVTTDAGNFASFVHRYIGFRQGQVFLASVVGAMGSGVPMAVAAALRRPNTQVVAFVGDGGALMTGNEIATACQYGANPIVVVSDNRMYGTIGMHSYMRYPERALMEGVRLTNPDFAQWARSFGAEGITIDDEAGIADGIARAFAVKTRPVVVHCRTSQIQMSAWRRYTRSETLP